MTDPVHHLPAPETLAEAMDVNWLSQVLAPLTGGAPITGVELVEKIVTVATKARFRVEWEGGSASLCIKAYLDMARKGNQRAVEAEFYRQLAPHLNVRIPECVTTVIDKESGQGLIIMRDLIAQGAVFNSALDAFTPDQMKSSLEQLALLHSRPEVLALAPWVGRKIEPMLAWNIQPVDKLQELLDGARGANLDARTRKAQTLVNAVAALAEYENARPAVPVHGDFHAGNSYRTKDGQPGIIDWSLIQQGGWALDVAYHMAAALSVEDAEAHEWDLLDHYIDKARALGVAIPARDEAREHYAVALAYGYYLWAVTTRVDPPVILMFVDRLGKAVMRHDTFRRLGVA